MYNARNGRVNTQITINVRNIEKGNHDHNK